MGRVFGEFSIAKIVSSVNNENVSDVLHFFPSSSFSA